MPKPPNAQLWVKVILPGVGQFGPGKVDLLRRIREHRSMAAAARSMGMSYRRAWLLVDEMNGLFRQPVVAKWQGGTSRGGATLTKFGESLVEQYDELLDRSRRANRGLLRKLGTSVRKA